MISAHNILLLDEESIIADGTSYSNAILLPTKAGDLVLASVVSSRVDGTYTVTLESSPDGTNWFTVDSCAAQSVNGVVIKATTNASFAKVRAKVVASTVTSGADLTVKVWYSLNK